MLDLYLRIIHFALHHCSGIMAFCKYKKVAVVDAGGHCSEIALCYKSCERDPKIVVALGRWSLFGGGR